MHDLFDLLPKETQDEIKEVLKAYDSVNLFERPDGTYKVSVGIFISNEMTKTQFIGEIRQEDVFTRKERRENFKKQFGYDCDWY